MSRALSCRSIPTTGMLVRCASLVLPLIPLCCLAQFQTWISGLHNLNVTHVNPAPNDVVWLATDNGVSRFDGNSFTAFTTFNSDITNGAAYWTATEADGDTWIGTAFGLNLFDGTAWTDMTAPLVGSGAQCILLDEPRVIVATLTGGLNIFNGPVWTNHQNPGVPQGSWIRSIDRDGADRIWVAMASSGLCVFDGSSWTTYNTSNSDLPSNVVWDVAVAPDQSIWAATNGGLVKFADGAWTIYDPSNSGLSMFQMKCVEVDDRGNVWCGSWGGGLTRFDGEGWTVFTPDNSDLPWWGINHLAADDHGYLWIGAVGGLARISITVSVPEAETPAALFSLQPNPATSQVRIVRTPTDGTRTALLITDLHGRPVWSQPLTSSAEDVDVSRLAAGTYVVQVTADAYRHTELLTIIR